MPPPESRCIEHERELGVVRQRLDEGERRFAEMRSDIKEIKDTVGAISLSLNSINVERRMLAGAAGMIGAVLTLGIQSFISLWKGK